MWVFTIDGFYSAVQHRDQPDHLMVRARVRADLVRMLKRLSTHVDIRSTPAGDYAYRVVLPKAVWAAYLTAATEAVDYGNFKSAIGEQLGHGRATVYLDVWSDLLRLQR